MSIGITYAIIAVLMVAAELVYFRIADRFNIIDKPNERSSHTKVVIRGGGVIFTIGLWVWSVFFGFHLPPLPYKLMLTYTQNYGTYDLPYLGQSPKGQPWGTVHETPLH